MKVFLALIFILVGANAFADQCNRDCNGGVTYDWPVVGGVTINNLCQTETGFKSLTPETICHSYSKVPNWACNEHREDCRPVSDNYRPQPNEWIEYRTVCTAKTVGPVEFAKTYETTECEPCYPVGESSECVLKEPKCRVVTKTISTTYYVNMYQAGSEHFEGGRVWMGMKKYAIPACK